VHGSTSVAGGRTPGATPGQGIEHRSDRANEVAQNVYKNKNLQGEFSDPDSPYYQGESGTDENGNPVGNCSEINAGCTASQEELEDYIGDEIIIIGSSGESLYYYHPDHLGSASVITDGSGNLREHIEYFAFGETWVQEGASKKTPFMYTGKELDQETGLYYYGARYYDPRTSVWQSVDPILEKYLPSGDPEKDKNLPGMGGFFNSGNLAGYTYTHQNPVRYVDPDGNVAQAIIGGILGAAEDLAFQGVMIAAGAQDGFSWGSLAASTGLGAATAGYSAAAQSGRLGMAAGKLLNKIDNLTPGGRKLSTHAKESLGRHKFKNLQQVDDIINNATNRIEQADGAIAHVQKVGKGAKARFNIVIEGEEGIVTGMLNFSKFDVKKMAANRGWENLPF